MVFHGQKHLINEGEAESVRRDEETSHLVKAVRQWLWRDMEQKPARKKLRV